MRWLALVALVGPLGAAPAWAQSKRYPPVEPDKDLEAERRSEVWESALHPESTPYKELVRDAQRLADHNVPDDIKAALDKLDAAVKLVPNAPDAYVARGRIHKKQARWASCADDLGRGEDYAKGDDRAQARIDLGTCQARAGRFAEAERTLVRAAAKTPTGEVWRDLGQVRIALGKLDEAIDALTAAVESANDATARWLLAMAYDRARRPSDAQDASRLAREKDPYFAALQKQQVLGTGDVEYINGLAHRYALQKPEIGLIYFRRFVKLAPDSAWRRRAEDHIRELATMKPVPEVDAIKGIDPDHVRAVLAKPIAAMRACMAKLPTSVFQVVITKVGPHTPEARDRPVLRLAPAGITVKLALQVGDLVDESTTTAAQRCIDTLANQAPVPALKERDTMYRISFNVVSP